MAAPITPQPMPCRACERQASGALRPLPHDLTPGDFDAPVFSLGGQDNYAFSPDGQDWGLPAYDWAAMNEDDLKWLCARTRHAARMYDRFRLDHVVGYFRMYVRKPGQRGYFDPDGDQAQRAHGELGAGAQADLPRGARSMAQLRALAGAAS